MKTRLQELRKQAGYKSANAFADYAGIKRGTYTDYEQGRIVPPIEKLWELADIFDVSLDYLVGRDFTRPEPEEEAPEIMAAYEKLDDTAKAYATASVQGMAERMGE